MNSSVSVQEKKVFLEWLLSRFDFEENGWLLEEISQDERKLEMVHFVDSMEGCPKGIHITFNEVSGMHFLFFKGSIKTRDVYTAFHELQLYRDEAYYIAIDFPEKKNNTLYQTVMEADEAEKAEMSRIADNLLDTLLRNKHADLLENELNAALDRNDMDAFYACAKKIRKWKTQ